MSSTMSVSPNGFTVSPALVTPKAKTDQTATAPQAGQASQKTAVSAKTDTVAISSQALNKLSSSGDNKTQKPAENGSGKTTAFSAFA